MNLERIGKRLARLRDELAGPGEPRWTQGRLAAETGLTVNQVARFEQSMAGSIEALLVLLAFYHRRGYNLTWILLDDDATVSKMRLADDTKSVPTHVALVRLGALKEHLVQQVDDAIRSLKD